MTEPHERVRLVGWLVAPLVGVESVGTPGATRATVVKFQTLDQALVPLALVAFARQ